MILYLGLPYLLSDLNTYFQIQFAVNFSQSPVFFFWMFKNDKIAPLKNLQFYMKMTDICDFFKCSTDDNISKSLKYVGNNVNSGSPGLLKDYTNFYKKLTPCYSLGNFLIFLVIWSWNTVLGVIVW